MPASEGLRERKKKKTQNALEKERAENPAILRVECFFLLRHLCYSLQYIL